ARARRSESRSGNGAPIIARTKATKQSIAQKERNGLLRGRAALCAHPLARNDGGDYPARRCRAAGLCAFFAGRRPVARRAWDFAAERLPFTLCLKASIRLTTLLGLSSGSAALIGLPDALRFTSFLSAFSYSSLNF